MGLYIPGMEMPKDGAVSLIVCSSGNVYTDGLIPVGEAIPVPPHGRLIDADEACRRFSVDADPRNGYMLYKLNNELSAIIPAEEGHNVKAD